MKKLILLSLIILPLIASAQSSKVKIKGGLASVDGVVLCQLEDDQTSTNSFYLNDIDGNQTLYFKWLNEDEMNYFEVYQASDKNDIIFEQKAVNDYQKWLIKSLHDAGVLTIGGIDWQALIPYATEYGHEFTRKRLEQQ